ncbi:MAG TPA: hypothetical protein DCS93_41545 [Microscillaceae bacterium]|nr:hypothetical protein [Microscillaceae bacterium]
MKKQSILFSALFLLITSLGVQAQSVDKIIDGYFEIIGGKDKFRKMKSMVMEGTGKSPQGEIQMKMYSQRPNKSKLEFTMQGKTFVLQAYDGQNAWGTNFMTRKNEKKPDEVAKEMAENAFEPLYLDYKKKGHKITLEGSEEIDGTECHKLKVTRKNGKVQYLFFDKESNALIMTRTTSTTGPMKGQQIESYVADYKEVDGIMMPHSLTQNIAGQKSTLTITKITINPKLEEKVFTFKE